MNLYRGCTHGCIYCDSRSTCYGMTHPFEDVEVKANAPELLERALRKRKNRCMLGTGSMCDPYIPLEEEFGLTRRCLELIDRFGFGVCLLTKSNRVLRDLPLLKRIQAQSKCVVQMTVTTFDDALCRIVEPHVSATSQRLDALRTLRDNGIPTVVWLCPILPWINDTEDNLRSILEACAEAQVRGVVCFGMGMTLRDGSREYYYEALDRHFPGLKARYMAAYGNAYRIPSPNEAHLMSVFHTFCEAHGILHRPSDVFAYLRAFPGDDFRQLSLF